MKKLLLLLIIPFWSFGQDLTYVPDDGFEYWIENNIDGASNGDINDDYVYKSALQGIGNIEAVTEITQTIPIYDLTGIEDFQIQCLHITDLFVSDIDLSSVSFLGFGSLGLGQLVIKDHQYLNNLVLPKDSVSRISISNNLQLENIVFQDELVFTSLSIWNGAFCELNIKGKVENDNLNEIVNFQISDYYDNLIKLDLSALSEVPFNTSFSLYTPQLNYLNLNNDIPIYNWNLATGFGVPITGDNLCVEVNDPSFCYKNNDWPETWSNVVDAGGEVNYVTSCNGPDCSNMHLFEDPIIKRPLVKKIDILGRATTNKKGFQLHIYDDGTVEKKYLIK